MQLFQRRRWIHPDRVDAGLAAFVRQLAWIDARTGLAMAGWRRTDPLGRPVTILASTIYSDHAWFLTEVARLQTLVDYAPVNEAAAALMVGEDAFERWDAPVDTPDGWSPGEDGFRQETGPWYDVAGLPSWTNAEGADGLVSWFLDHHPVTDRPADIPEGPAGGPAGLAGPVSGGGLSVRIEEWDRIH